MSSLGGSTHCTESSWSLQLLQGHVSTPPHKSFSCGVSVGALTALNLPGLFNFFRDMSVLHLTKASRVESRWEHSLHWIFLVPSSSSGTCQYSPCNNNFSNIFSSLVPLALSAMYQWSTEAWIATNSRYRSLLAAIYCIWASSGWPSELFHLSSFFQPHYGPNGPRPYWTSNRIGYQMSFLLAERGQCVKLIT
jgi:hypothetical protein